MSKMDEDSIEQLLNQLIVMQQEVLLKCGRRLIPHLTGDDILQPNDFPELEMNPHFRYEEGILAGILAARMALRSERGIGLG